MPAGGSFEPILHADFGWRGMVEVRPELKPVVCAGVTRHAVGAGEELEFSRKLHGDLLPHGRTGAQHLAGQHDADCAIRGDLARWFKRHLRGPVLVVARRKPCDAIAETALVQRQLANLLRSVGLFRTYRTLGERVFCQGQRGHDVGQWRIARRAQVDLQMESPRTRLAYGGRQGYLGIGRSCFRAIDQSCRVAGFLDASIPAHPGPLRAPAHELEIKIRFSIAGDRHIRRSLRQDKKSRFCRGREEGCKQGQGKREQYAAKSAHEKRVLAVVSTGDVTIFVTTPSSGPVWPRHRRRWRRVSRAVRHPRRSGPGRVATRSVWLPPR